MLLTEEETKQTIQFHLLLKKETNRDFAGGTVVRNPPASARDTGSSLDPGRSHMLRSN